MLAVTPSVIDIGKKILSGSAMEKPPKEAADPTANQMVQPGASEDKPAAEHKDDDELNKASVPNTE